MLKLLATLITSVTALGSCGPSPALMAACPVVPTEYGDLFGYNLQHVKEGAWRWVAPDGSIYGYTLQEDGLIYQIPWCAKHMPIYSG
jgi:hypothetical protein